MQNKILGLLGLSMKAGKVKAGEFSVEKSIKAHKAKLVLVAVDASENTEKKFRQSCFYYHIPIFSYGTKEELGRGIGKEMRSSLCIEDEGFAKRMIEILDGGNADVGRE